MVEAVQRPDITLDSTYPLAEASAAHRRASRGGLQGKVVLIALLWPDLPFIPPPNPLQPP
nr:zinc-binding dehydrogenase [Pseudomonas sp. NFACC37-1]